MADRDLLDRDFFARPAVEVAPDLIGCALLRDGAGGVIVEAEAYHDHEPACHAYVGLTARTEVLFGPPGHAYVYLSYGIHELFNVVTGPEGSGQAVLIRALEPRWGIEEMRARRGLERERLLCAGPGRLSQALGITLADNRADLTTPPFELRGRIPGERETIAAGPRIGITKAAELPWRWARAGSPWVSAARL